MVEVRELAQLHGHVSRVALGEPDEAGKSVVIQRRKARNGEGKVVLVDGKPNEAMVYAAEYVADGRRVGEKGGPINAVVFGDVEGPREEGVVDNAGDGGGAVSVLL